MAYLARYINKYKVYVLLLIIRVKSSHYTFTECYFCHDISYFTLFPKSNWICFFFFLFYQRDNSLLLVYKIGLRCHFNVYLWKHWYHFRFWGFCVPSSVLVVYCIQVFLPWIYLSDVSLFSTFNIEWHFVSFVCWFWQWLFSNS